MTDGTFKYHGPNSNLSKKKKKKQSYLGQI